VSAPVTTANINFERNLKAMNCHQRRTAAARQKHPSEDCPRCNALAVMLHFMQHGTEIDSMDCKPLIYTVDEDDEDKTTASVDFGVLAIAYRLSAREHAIFSW
jgi:hypothetical protein